MMMHSYIIKNPLVVSILLFLVLFATIVMVYPAFLFNVDGSIRQFGIGYKNKTIFPMWLMAIVLGIFSYLYIVYYTLYSH